MRVRDVHNNPVVYQAELERLRVGWERDLHLRFGLPGTIQQEVSRGARRAQRACRAQ